MPIPIAQHYLAKLTGRLIFAASTFSVAFLTGCSARLEPRVVAERMFEGSDISVFVTTYPGEPKDIVVYGAMVVADGVKRQSPASIRPQVVNGEKMWLIAFREDPARIAEQVTCVQLEIDVRYAGRRFRITVPFHRPDPTGPWVTGRERIRDFGKCREAALEQERGESRK